MPFIIEVAQHVAHALAPLTPYFVPAATLVAGLIAAGVAVYGFNKSASTALTVADRQIRAATENARRQTQATVISANRQRWIDAVRDDVSALLAAELKYRELHRVAARKDTDDEAWKAMNLHLSELYLLKNRLLLRLNPDKPLHKALRSAIETLVEVETIREGGEAAEAVVTAAKTLLKNEWERVKREATGDFDVSSAAEL